MAGKYTYICYCDLSPEGNAASTDEWKKFLAKEDELAEKHGVEIVLRGTPFGVSAGYVTVYRTDKYIDDLMDMIMETGRSKYVSSARTVTVTPLIFPQ
jgi:hypothetical protein